jgi:hypothetical protein
MTFNAPTSNNINSNAQQATNAPTYSNVSTSSSFAVQYCPRTIKIILSNGVEFDGRPMDEGTVVNCSADGGSSGVVTTYTWTNTANDVIHSNNPTVTIPAGNYNFTCTANSTVSCGVGSTKTCNDLRKTISGTGIESDKSCVDNMGCILPAVLVPVLGVTAIITVILIVKYCCCKSAKNQKNGKHDANHGHLNSQTTSTVNNASYHDSPEMQRSRNLPPNVVRVPLPTHQSNYPPYIQRQMGCNPPQMNTVDPTAVVYAEVAPSLQPGSRKPIVGPSETVYAHIASA